MNYCTFLNEGNTLQTEAAHGVVDWHSLEELRGGNAVPRLVEMCKNPNVWVWCGRAGVGSRTPTLCSWKCCPWHAPPQYSTLIFTDSEPVGSNSWKHQWQNSRENSTGTLFLSAVLNPLLFSPKILQAGSNPLREHFQPAQEGRGRNLAVQIFPQYSREYGLQRSPGEQNKEPCVLNLCFTS